MILPSPALRRLLALKVRAAARKQVRRARRPAGIFFALVGALVILAWVGSLLLSQRAARGPSLPREELELAARLLLGFLLFLTVVGAFSHRGLYLPRDEIERLFSAPVSRSDLVRYRLLSSLLRSLFGALLFALVSAPRLPSRALGFAGVAVSLLFLPLVGQAVSLLAGDAENRFARRVSRLPLRFIGALGAVAMIGVFAVMAMSNAPGELLQRLRLGPGWRGLLQSEALQALTAPLQPWSKLVCARSAAEFLPWLAVAAVLWVALFELVARIPVDYRELSLATSADVARILNRRRTIGGASASEVSRRAAGFRVPWLYGRGPFGAIAWRKTGSIVRKARGTLWVSLFVVGLITLMSMAVAPAGESQGALKGALVIALAGTLYLGTMLRFDFREDLDCMDQIKAYPLAPWRVFAAMLLPEVTLVSLLLAGSILLRGAITGQADVTLAAVIGFVPMLALVWSSLDNAVFLLAPIRPTPGQEGALHHAGRALVLMLLRLAAFAVAGALLGLSFLAARWLGEAADLSAAASLAVGVLLAALVLGAEVAGLIALGGRLLRRFDVARDRG